ncbi:GSCOCG00011472001-RA-CDS [Cotesia congregata]|nr:GSCOCG00011472001-RA-CDS [Cotesia congregata]
MSSHEEIIISDDDADIEDVEDINQNLSKGLSSRSKFNLENSNTALFNKYINISHETLKVNHLAMQGNLIAMQNSHLAMKNLQDLTESILKQINFNSINLKDKAKSELQAKTDRKSEKEFQCSHCPSKFKLNFSLIRHMSSFHGSKEMNDRPIIKQFVTIKIKLTMRTIIIIIIMTMMIFVPLMLNIKMMT